MEHAYCCHIVQVNIEDISYDDMLCAMSIIDIQEQ